MMMYEGGVDVAKKAVEQKPHGKPDLDATIQIEAVDNNNDLLLLRIADLKKQKEGILAFRDIVHADRTILARINSEIMQLQKEFFEKEKAIICKMIDRMGGAYSASQDRDYSPEETKMIIEDVLAGRKTIKVIPRSPIMGSTENLRDKVQKLLEFI